MSNAFAKSTTLLMAAAVAAVCFSPTHTLAQTVPTPPRPAQTTAVPSKPRPAPQAAAPQAPVTTQGLAPAKSASEDVVARVGSTTISSDDIRSYVAGLGIREQTALTQDPSMLSQAVRLLIANRLVLQEVLAKKWDQQPNVTAQIDRMREAALVELYLQSATLPPANYPSDDDLQKVYDANRNALLMPRQFELAQIFVAIPKDADKAAEDKAKKSVEDVQRKLKAPGAEFGAIAAADNDATNGGALGWVAEGQIRPEIQAHVMGLAKGAISEPIRLDDGWHILKLLDTKSSYTRTLPEVKDQLVQQMRAERAAALRRAYLADLLKKNPSAVNEIALSKVFGEQARATR